MLKKRLLAASLDWGIISVIAILISVFAPTYQIQIWIFEFEVFKFLLNALILLLYVIFKDFLFGNVSLGKRIFGLKIVNKSTGKVSSKKIIILRNILTAIPIIFYLDLIILIKDKGERYCDKWLGTTVVFKTVDTSLS